MIRLLSTLLPPLTVALNKVILRLQEKRIIVTRDSCSFVRFSRKKRPVIQHILPVRMQKGARCLRCAHLFFLFGSVHDWYAEAYFFFGINEKALFTAMSTSVKDSKHLLASIGPLTLECAHTKKTAEYVLGVCGAYFLSLSVSMFVGQVRRTHHFSVPCRVKTTHTPS